MSAEINATNQPQLFGRVGNPVVELADDLRLHPLDDSGSRCGPVGLPASRLFAEMSVAKPLVITGSHFDSYRVKTLIEEFLPGYRMFSGFSANPRYEEVVEGVRAFRESGCDSVISVGGGSAIDVAKCIKLFAPLPGDGLNTLFVDQEAGGSDLTHIAVPSTAGTGSEATHFAVVYVNGNKHSVAHPCLAPDAAILDPSMLEGLPPYQKKATLLDALCQAIESYWSRRSNDESRGFSRRAIPTIMASALPYLENEQQARRAMHIASYQAGRAINITTTTAPHAMSYKLTSQFGIAHGHAVSLCMPQAWRMLIARGDEQTQRRLTCIAELTTGVRNANALQGLEAFEGLVEKLALPAPKLEGFDANLLARSVNTQRLSNFPINVTEPEIANMYESIRASL